MTRDEYVEAIKRAAISAGTKATVHFIVSKLPFFASAIPNYFLGLVVGWILKIAVKYTELGAFFFYVDLRTNAQAKDFEDKALKNYQAQQSGTPEQQAQAEKELIDSFRTFARFAA